jgi:hypothetical protein
LVWWFISVRYHPEPWPLCWRWAFETLAWTHTWTCVAK